MYSEYEKKPTTRAWDLYEAGKLYNNRLSPNLYKMVDANTEFLAGNQWLNLPKTPALNALPKPVFNILKRVNNLFLASLTSSAARINLEPLTYVDGENLDDPNTNAASFANAEVANLFEKFDMDYKIRQALSDGSVTGDYCAHFYWDPHARPYGGAFGSHRGEICMELVDGVNVMFGNPNNREVEVQPYILVYGRDTVQSLKDEVERRNKGAKKNRKKSQETEERYSADDLIQADSDFDEQVGESGKIEITGDDGGKAAYIYLYEKVTEYVGGDYVTTVHVSKMTKNTVIFEDVDTGLSCYPIAWGNWETQKNQYHGRALITGLIPNQIYINNMFAMVMRHQQLMGFPKMLYNKNYLSQWTNTLGQAIGVENLPDNMRLSDVAYQIQPADMSNQIMQAIDLAMSYTKECLGATDAQMGNVKADNTSAIIALQSSSTVPLENPKAELYRWLGSIGRILLDMMGCYYGTRPVVKTIEVEEPLGTPEIDPMTGMPAVDPNTGETKMRTRKISQRVLEDFDFSVFKHLWFNVKVDIGAATYWNKIAMIQTLDNLRREGMLDIIDYLERMPNDQIPDKEALLAKKKIELQMQQDMQAQAAMAEQQQQPQQPETTSGATGQLDESTLLSTLPPSLQAKYNHLNPESRAALLQKAASENAQTM